MNTKTNVQFHLPQHCQVHKYHSNTIIPALDVPHKCISAPRTACANAQFGSNPPILIFP